MMKGFQNKDPRFIDLGNHSGKSTTNILTEIPFDELGDLSEVRVLTAKYNQLKYISPRIGEMTALDMLDLSSNPLVELPEEFGNLHSLKNFRASDIIETDHEELSNLMDSVPGYKPKFLSDAGLKTLPSSFGNLKKLQSLALDGNRFKEIPTGVFQCKNLTYLDMARNQLEYISPEIGQLVNLSYLKLSINNFRELPETIGNLKKLQRLRLDYLNLDSLPQGIGGLRSLEMIEICHGKVGDIPTEVKHLKNLKDVYLIHTEISETDLNVLKVFLPQANIHRDPLW